MWVLILLCNYIRTYVLVHTHHQHMFVCAECRRCGQRACCIPLHYYFRTYICGSCLFGFRPATYGQFQFKLRFFTFARQARMYKQHTKVSICTTCGYMYVNISACSTYFGSSWMPVCVCMSIGRRWRWVMLWKQSDRKKPLFIISHWHSSVYACVFSRIYMNIHTYTNIDTQRLVCLAAGWV